MGTSLGRRGHTAVRGDAENTLVSRMAHQMVDGSNWHDSDHQQDAFRRVSCICQASG